MEDTLRKILPEVIKKKFRGRKGMQNIASNMGWISTRNLFRLVIGLFVGIFVARYLGPSQYGLIAFAGAFTALFVPFVNLGIKKVSIREIVKRPTEKNSLLGTTFVLQLIMGLISFFAAACIIFLIRTDDLFAVSIVTMISASLVFCSFETIEYWFDSQVKSKFAAQARIFALVFIALVKIILIFIGAPLIYFAVAILVDWVVISLALIFVYFKNGQSIFRWKFRKGIAIGLIADSWPILFSSIGMVIYMRIDQVMLSLLIGDYSVGIYSIAVNISEMLFFVPAAVSASILPAMILLKKKSIRDYLVKCQRFTDIMVWSSFVFIIPLALFSWVIISFLYGNAYIESSGVLFILSFSLFFAFLAHVVSNYIIIENLTKIIMCQLIMGAVSNILLNFWLMPIYGVYGAAISTVLAYFVIFFFGNLVFKKTRIILIMTAKSFNLIRVIREARLFFK